MKFDIHVSIDDVSQVLNQGPDDFKYFIVK